VLTQTHTNLELVVVFDGSDDETVLLLETVDDHRLRIEVTQQRGASAARNTGVRLVDADWVAFLDDDDFWRPRKLEAQLALARHAKASLPVVSCRALNVMNRTSNSYPLRMPLPNEPVSEFLFAPRGWLARRGGIQTPTILAPRALFERILFDETLTRHEDWDWLLRAVQISGTELIYVPEILVEVDKSSDLQRLSSSRDWRYSFDWIRSRRDLVTRRAYSGFLLTVVPVNAARGGAGTSDFLRLLKESWQGRPGFVQLAIFALWWLLPDRLIRWLGRVANRLR
jgi:glycosyltransferase involved in cell wall biosynthesis